MNWLRVAGLLGFLAVALGAFGAHALKARLSSELLQVWNTAVLYHLIHALALFALALFARSTSTSIHIPAWLFTAGILLFSGSLYALALSGIKPLGAITPVGGLCFLAAWLWVSFKLA